MKKDVTVQRVSGVVNLSDFPSEAFAASGWYVNDTTEYQAAEYAEETVVHTAGILRELGIAVHGDHARTGVRADWMEQDGPALFITGETDTYRCETMQRLAL